MRYDEQKLNRLRQQKEAALAAARGLSQEVSDTNAAVRHAENEARRRELSPLEKKNLDTLRTELELLRAAQNEAQERWNNLGNLVINLEGFISKEARP